MRLQKNMKELNKVEDNAPKNVTNALFVGSTTELQKLIKEKERLSTMSDFDFGFTAVDEDELDAVQKVQKSAEANSVAVEKLEDKVNKIYNAVTIVD